MNSSASRETRLGIQWKGVDFALYDVYVVGDRGEIETSSVLTPCRMNRLIESPLLAFHISVNALQ